MAEVREFCAAPGLAPEDEEVPPQHIKPRPEEGAIAGSMLTSEPPPHRPHPGPGSSSSSWLSRSSARMAASSSRGISMAQANSSASASSAAVGIAASLGPRFRFLLAGGVERPGTVR